MFRLSLLDKPLGFVASTLEDGAKLLTGRLGGAGVGFINGFAFWPPLGSPARKTLL